MQTRHTLRPALVLFILATLALGWAGRLQPEKHYGTVTLENGESLPYAYHLPQGYDPERAYPVLIGPGDGTPGSDNSFFWKEDPSEYGWIVVETMAFLENAPVETTRRLLDHLEQQFKVEGGRFHAVGYSRGGAPTFRVVLALADRFQSITGIPGHPTATDEATLSRLKTMKVQFIVGENDGYWRRESERAHRLLQALGVDTRLEIIDDGGHVLRELVGRGFMERMQRLRED